MGPRQYVPVLLTMHMKKWRRTRAAKFREETSKKTDSAVADDRIAATRHLAPRLTGG
jgi:hypothetical protein